MKARTPNQAEVDGLAQVLSSLKERSQLDAFLRDLMTDTELAEISERWRVARLLDAGRSYSQIIDETGLSSTTIARVAGGLKNGAGGYRMALRNLSDLNISRRSTSP